MTHGGQDQRSWMATVRFSQWAAYRAGEASPRPIRRRRSAICRRFREKRWSWPCPQWKSGWSRDFELGGRTSGVEFSDRTAVKWTIRKLIDAAHKPYLFLRSRAKRYLETFVAKNFAKTKVVLIRPLQFHQANWRHDPRLRRATDSLCVGEWQEALSLPHLGTITT